MVCSIWSTLLPVFVCFSFLYSYSSAGIPIAPQIFWAQVIKIGQHPLMAPKKAMKTKTSPKTPWNPSLLAQMCRQGTNQKPPDDFDTIAKVVCVGDLLHGLHVELNLPGGGNNCFRLAGTKILKPGAIYMIHVNYDADVSDSSDEKDEFSVGTISDVRYLGTAASLAEACKSMTRKVCAYVHNMLSFNEGSDDDSSDQVC